MAVGERSHGTSALARLCGGVASSHTGHDHPWPAVGRRLSCHGVSYRQVRAAFDGAGAAAYRPVADGIQGPRRAPHYPHAGRFPHRAAGLCVCADMLPVCVHTVHLRAPCWDPSSASPACTSPSWCLCTPSQRTRAGKNRSCPRSRLRLLRPGHCCANPLSWSGRAPPLLLQTQPGLSVSDEQQGAPSKTGLVLKHR